MPRTRTRLKKPEKPTTSVKKLRWEPDGPLTIKINDDWRIQSDGLQYIIQSRNVRRKGARIGTEVWRKRAYFRTLDSAILYLAANRIMTIPGTYDFEAMGHIIKTLDEIKEECIRAIGQALQRKEEAA